MALSETWITNTLASQMSGLYDNNPHYERDEIKTSDLLARGGSGTREERGEKRENSSGIVCCVWGKTPGIYREGNLKPTHQINPDGGSGLTHEVGDPKVG